MLDMYPTAFKTTTFAYCFYWIPAPDPDGFKHTPTPQLVQGIVILKVRGSVEAVGLDAADVMRLHGIEGSHEVGELALEAAANAGKLDLRLAHRLQWWCGDT